VGGDRTDSRWTMTELPVQLTDGLTASRASMAGTYTVSSPRSRASATSAMMPGVCRKGSSGSDSAANTRFVERRLIIVATRRQPGRPAVGGEGDGSRCGPQTTPRARNRSYCYRLS
jgi:hypothetical protein